MKQALENAAGWAVAAIFLIVLVAVSLFFQEVNEAGQEAGGIIGFLAEWFFG